MATTTTPSSIPISLSHPNPRILIIGAGVGGLAMANLCETVGLDYLVLEKASEFKPLGSSISLDHRVFPFLDQLGIYEDLLKVGKPYQDLTVHTANLKTGKLKERGVLEAVQIDRLGKFGYPSLMLARPDLMEALIKPVPKSKLLMQKKVTSVQQDKNGVVVQVADGSSYHGHILIGADGCYSPVREAMFAEVEKRKQLPQSDKAPLKFDIDCIVGVTEPLDPIEFPEMAKKTSEFEVVLPKQEKVSVWFMPLSRNRLGWMVNEVMPEEKKAAVSNGFNKTKEENDKSATQSEWGAESAEAMCKRFQDYPTPYGKATLQTFIDKTPKELISKVLLEEKFFETWQDGRTCLIGDACHKVLPFGAVGATNAMLDALQLVNLLYDLKSSSYESIREMLQRYERMRFEYGRAAVKGSSLGGKLFHAKGWTGDLARYTILHVIPNALMDKGRDKVARYRPQCGFLPFKSLGSNKHDKQEYCVRYVMEQEQANGAKKFDEETLISIDKLTAVYTTVAV